MQNSLIQNLPELLIKRLKEQYNDKDIKKIINGYLSNKKVTFRINTLKVSREEVVAFLNSQNILYSMVNWSKDAIILNDFSEKQIESWELYKNGSIYLQNLSSMLPPIFLDPKPQEDILDMAAAPRQ